MKAVAVLIVAFISFVSAASVKDLEPSRTEVAERVRSVANIIVDAVVELLRKYAVDNSLEPMAVPDLTQNFTLVIWIMEFEGFLYLTSGWLRDLTSMLRSGEASVEFEGDLVHITTHIEFNRLLLNYDYRVVVMGIEPTGKLTGTAEDLKLKVELTADLSTYKTTLSALSVTNAAKIAVEVGGGGVQDEIVNEIAKLVTPYFEKDILNFVEEKFKLTLEEALVEFDIRDIIDS